MANAGSFAPIVPWDLEVIRIGTVPNQIEGASQSWKAGALLILSSGKVVTAGTAPSTVSFIAQKDATGTTNAKVESWKIIPGRLYELTFVGSGTAGAFAQADIGANVGVLVDATTGIWYADNADTGDQFTVVSLAPNGPAGGWAVGDTKVRVLGTFDSANVAGF